MQQHVSFIQREYDSSRLLDAPISSVLLELQALDNVVLPRINTGPWIHGMFHQLISRTDPTLSARLHNEPGYRPFTLSPLLSLPHARDHIQISADHTYHVRATLLDGGHLWHCLSLPLLEEGPLEVVVGVAKFKLTRVLSMPKEDSRVMKTSWLQISSLAPAQEITLSFLSPTAFNINGNYFALFPVSTPTYYF